MRKIQKIGAGIGCLLALGLVAGCGGEEAAPKVASLSQGAGGPAAASAAPTQSSAEQSRAFVQCLRDNGLKVDDPDPQTGRLDFQSLSNADRPTVEKALEACRDKMPQLNETMDKLRNPDAETKAKMVAFAQCMRDAGQDFPDPGPSGFDFGDFKRDDPGFMKAARQCQRTHPFADFGGRR